MRTFVLLLSILTGPVEPPTVTIEKDDTAVTQSCRVVIPQDAVIEDKNDSGVIQIGASDIVIEFSPSSVLRGAGKDKRPDEYHGYGIRLNGHTGVTIRGAKISGYHCALRATRADGLIVEDVDVFDCRRDHLRSTPAAEDIGDWLSPHENDKNEWIDAYGAGIYVEDSNKITVRKCRARQGQNGCASSGERLTRLRQRLQLPVRLGIALWRSNHNVITRNAVDFCVRGYSHGIYNRGQDSAAFWSSSSAQTTSSRRTRPPTAATVSSASPGARPSAKPPPHRRTSNTNAREQRQPANQQRLLLRRRPRHRDDLLLRQPVPRQPAGRQRHLRRLGRILTGNTHRRQHHRR